MRTDRAYLGHGMTSRLDPLSRAPRDRPASRPRALPHGRETSQYSEGAAALRGHFGQAAKEPLKYSRAGAPGCLPGMMARSRTKHMVGAMCEDGAKASAPASPGPTGLRDMRRLLRRPPRPRSIDYELRSCGRRFAA